MQAYAHSAVMWVLLFNVQIYDDVGVKIPCMASKFRPQIVTWKLADHHMES